VFTVSKDAFLVLVNWQILEERTKYRMDKKRELRAKIIELKDGKCEICGKICDLQCDDSKYFAVHHWHPFKLPSGGVKEREEYWILKHLDDVSLLCKSCHQIIHWTFRKLARLAKEQEKM